MEIYAQQLILVVYINKYHNTIEIVAVIRVKSITFSPPSINSFHPLKRWNSLIEYISTCEYVKQGLPRNRCDNCAAMIQPSCSLSLSPHTLSSLSLSTPTPHRRIKAKAPLKTHVISSYPPPPIVVFVTKMVYSQVNQYMDVVSSIPMVVPQSQVVAWPQHRHSNIDVVRVLLLYIMQLGGKIRVLLPGLMLVILYHDLYVVVLYCVWLYIE